MKSLNSQTKILIYFFSFFQQILRSKLKVFLFKKKVQVLQN